MSIYCTYLTIYSGSKLPMFYIGSTSVEKVNKGYHGSVKSKEYEIIWLSELKLNPHLFKTKIIKTFNIRNNAFLHEEYIQRTFKISKNVMYMNKATANQKFNMFGKTHSKETKHKNSIANSGENNGMFGKQHSKETIELQSDIRIKWMENNEHPKGMLDKHHSEEFSKNASIRTSGKNNPNYGKRKELIECPHCHKIGGLAGMAIWHFDKCKFKS